MKKHLLLFLTLFVWAGTAWGQYSGTGTFTKITSLVDLTDGYYVIARTGDLAPAMTNTNAGSFFTSSDATISLGVITDPASTMVWKIETNGGGRTIYSENSSKFVSYTGSSNAAQAVDAVSTDNQRWTITYVGTEFIFSNVAIPTRLLQYNASSPRFAAYTSNQTKFDLYKYAASTPTVTIANTGSPSVGDIVQNTNDVVLFGFSLTPTASINFTAVSITTAGTATTDDYSNFELVYDADGNGIYDDGESVVSDTKAFGNSMAFTMSGQTTFSAERRYLLIADAAVGATVGRTFTASIAAAGDVTTTGDESGTATGNEQTIISATAPVITVTGALSAFANTSAGANSSSQSYSVEGANLTENITITAPTNFTVSTDDASFLSSVELTESGGTVNSTTIYVRFQPSSGNGANPGNITHVSGAATTQNQAVSGFAYAAEPTTPASSLSFTSVGETSFTLNWTRGDGDSVLVVMKADSAVTFDPSDKTTYSVNAAFGTSTLLGTASYGVYKGTGDSVAVTGLSASTTYHVEVFEFNVGSAALTHNYNVSSTLVGSQETNAPIWVINEVLADPDATNGDANGDGVVSTTNDEFIEIVYQGNVTIDISGWKINDLNGTKHVFPTGTIVQPNQAIVVFGGGTPTGNFGSSLVFTASTSTLSINNSNETMSLLNDSDVVIASEAFGSDTGDNQSVTRDSDLIGSFVKHSVATGSSGSLFSPGTKINGTAFYTPSIQITGTAGWRMLSSPKKGFTVSDISDNTAIQGVTGGTNAGSTSNFYTYNSSGAFASPTNVSTAFGDGYGFITYFYNNATAGSTVFPITLDVSGTEPSSDVDVTLNTSTQVNSSYFTMVGNPFASNLNTNSITVTGGTIQANIQFWNNVAGAYAIQDRTGPFVVAPWSGFWVESSDAATSIKIPTSGKTTSAAGTSYFAKEVAGSLSDLKFELKSSYNIDAAIQVQFREQANLGWDLWDASKFTSLNEEYALLGFQATARRNLKAVESLPNDLSEVVELPMEVLLSGATQEVNLSWNSLANFPESWTFTLIDSETKSSINLREVQTYSFVAQGSVAKATTQASKSPLASATGSSRLTLVINPGTATTAIEAGNSVPTQTSLAQNFPNPFNPSTTISFGLPTQSQVRLSVFDMLGREVSVLVNGVKAAGNYELSFDASRLSSGMYIYRLEANGSVLTKKMTLIK